MLGKYFLNTQLITSLIIVYENNQKPNLLKLEWKLAKMWDRKPGVKQRKIAPEASNVVPTWSSQFSIPSDCLNSTLIIYSGLIFCRLKDLKLYLKIIKIRLVFYTFSKANLKSLQLTYQNFELSSILMIKFKIQLPM